jgi:hypothetical protein
MTRHRTFRARPVRVPAALAAALAIAATSLVVATAPASAALAAASLPSPATVNEVKPGPQDPKPPRAAADNDQYHSLIFIPGCFDVNHC